MIKMVIQDFYSTRNQAFREGWNKSAISWIGVWFGFNLMFNICGNGDEWNMSAEIVLITEVLVLWCTFLLHAMYPNHLGKFMFLIPVDKDEKKEYLKTAYLLKGLTMSGVQILAMFIFVIRGQMLLGYAVLSVISLFMLNLIIGLENFYGQFHLITLEGSIGTYKTEWCVQGFSVVVFAFLINGGIGSQSIVMCIVGVIIQALLCLWVLGKRYREQMEQGLDWEQVQYWKGEKHL